jgi:hypothetical protein
MNELSKKIVEPFSNIPHPSMTLLKLSNFGNSFISFMFKIHFSSAISQLVNTYSTFPDWASCESSILLDSG